MRLRRLPIRTRLTVSCVLGLALVLAGFSWFVYVRTSDNILEEVDAGLRSRAQVLTADVREHGPTLPAVESALLERDEAFAQIADRSGRVLESSAIVAGLTLVDPAVVAELTEPALFEARVPGIDDVTRVIAVPIRSSGTPYVVLVGSSLQDRRDQVLQLGVTLAAAGLVTLVLTGFGAWWIVGAALQPVDRMRRRADTISSADPGTRLPVQAGRDEISRLAETLNAMLDRIDEAATRERELVDRASHELRTPLAIQRVGLDLALRGPETVEALRAGLRDASEENTHLARLAEDLLVLSRARGGQLPVHRREVRLEALINDAVARNAAGASSASVELTAQDGPTLGVAVRVDPDWTRQALDDLLDNSIRMTPPGGSVTLRGATDDGGVRFLVEDTGPGFDEAFLARAFDPFTRDGRGSADRNGAGLGLSIVRAIAEAHGGSAKAENTATGARVTLVLR
jgi:two-component system OmpR family sensor kinase